MCPSIHWPTQSFSVTLPTPVFFRIRYSVLIYCACHGLLHLDSLDVDFLYGVNPVTAACVTVCWLCLLRLSVSWLSLCWHIVSGTFRCNLTQCILTHSMLICSVWTHSCLLQLPVLTLVLTCCVLTCCVLTHCTCYSHLCWGGPVCLGAQLLVQWRAHRQAVWRHQALHGHRLEDQASRHCWKCKCVRMGCLIASNMSSYQSNTDKIISWTKGIPTEIIISISFMTLVLMFRWYRKDLFLTLLKFLDM